MALKNSMLAVAQSLFGDKIVELIQAELTFANLIRVQSLSRSETIGALERLLEEPKIEIVM